MNRTIKQIGNYTKVTFDHALAYSMPGQCVQLDGKYFAIYESLGNTFSILVNKDSHYVNNDPEKISDPLGNGFSSTLSKRAIVVAGGTGIGAVVPVIKLRNKYGLSTDVIFYTKGDIGPIRLDQATIGMCRNVIFWDTSTKGRPIDPLAPLVDKQGDSVVFVAGPKSLVTATQEVAKNFNYVCFTNF
jgi:NAD(P)H-flavin reductase